MLLRTKEVWRPKKKSQKTFSSNSKSKGLSKLRREASDETLSTPPGRHTTQSVKSGPSLPAASSTDRKDYSVPDHLLEREKAALEEIDRKKKSVVPAHNKGAYQPIDSETNLHEVGRKV